VSDGYIIIGLDEIVDIARENGGRLEFMFARQIAPFDREIIFSSSYIEKIINKADKCGYKIKEVSSDSLQWKKDKFYVKNIEKWSYVEIQTLGGEKYYIAAQTKSQLKKNIEIGDVYLDIKEIVKMIEEEKSRFGYMKESLDYLIEKGKITTIRVNTEKGNVIEKEAVNILDFWGVVKLYFMGKVLKRIFGIDDYKIGEFKDEKELINGDKFNISGYKLTSEYGGIKLESRIYDASHIYEEENKKYKEERETEKNSYITLALIRDILLEGDPAKEDQKIIKFYKEARRVTGYDIPILLIDDEESNYTVSIGENEIDYIINKYRYNQK